MALKYFQLSFCITLLIFLVSSHIGHATIHDHSDDESAPSAFEFIKHLEGYHKGNKSKEIHLLKKYLHNFGYLDLDQAHAGYDDVFDLALEAAIKSYQKFFHITATGILDANTVSKMVKPRCGVPDRTPLLNSMQTHYTFFPNTPRWPPYKTHLTYNILPNTPSNAFGPVKRAFHQWESTTRFRFSEVRSDHGADIVIGFFRRAHGDGHEFDGPGGTLAHAFALTNGRFHYDADERWVDGAEKGAFDLETLAIHEIGHVLGLGHSSVEDEIMWPIFAPGVRKNLHEGDIEAIRVLYDV